MWCNGTCRLRVGLWFRLRSVLDQAIYDVFTTSDGISPVEQLCED